MKRNILSTMALVILLACVGLVACESGGGSGQGGQNDIYVPGMDTDTTTPTATATATATPTTNSTPTPEPTEDPQKECLSKIAGTWTFVTPRATGTLTMNSDGIVTGITQSTCSNMILGSVDGYPNAELVNGIVYIKYTAVCNGITYPYLLRVSFVDGNCNQLSGEKDGQYETGITESIALQKQ